MLLLTITEYDCKIKGSFIYVIFVIIYFRYIACALQHSLCFKPSWKHVDFNDYCNCIQSKATFGDVFTCILHYAKHNAASAKWQPNYLE